MALSLSLVVATYNRLDGILSLLSSLERQTLPRDSYEVIVIDDGSREPVQSHIEALKLPLKHQIITQKNQGQAAARHRGVEAASGDVIVIVDDDMELESTFLEAHLEAHEAGAEVVLGHIMDEPGLEKRPLFERFHALHLSRLIAKMEAGAPARGAYLCTGNVSFRRNAFLEIGGFNHKMSRSEDRDLGLRFELAGKKIVFGSKARSIHHSDHQRLDVWMKRAFDYGIYDRRCALEKKSMPEADPWHFFFEINPISRPLAAAAIASPKLGQAFARLAMSIAEEVDKKGFSTLGLQGATLVYGLQYFSGMSSDAGSLRNALLELRDYLKRADSAKTGISDEAVRGIVEDVRKDFANRARYRQKYHAEQLKTDDIYAALVSNVGLQSLAVVRVMQHLWRNGHYGPAKIVSRLIRHLYGMEIHPGAAIAPGVSFVHGNGIVIGQAAKIASGCILFHNVTLGDGMHPKARLTGAPTLEEDVHVGPGATLIGPITIGRGSKIMAGAVVTDSVPPNSLVQSFEPEIKTRSNVVSSQSSG